MPVRLNVPQCGERLWDVYCTIYCTRIKHHLGNHKNRWTGKSWSSKLGAKQENKRIARWYKLATGKAHPTLS